MDIALIFVALQRIEYFVSYSLIESLQAIVNTTLFNYFRHKRKFEVFRNNCLYSSATRSTAHTSTQMFFLPKCFFLPNCSFLPKCFFLPNCLFQLKVFLPKCIFHPNAYLDTKIITTYLLHSSQVSVC